MFHNFKNYILNVKSLNYLTKNNLDIKCLKYINCDQYNLQDSSKLTNELDGYIITL